MNDFDFGVMCGLELAATICEDRAAKHSKRGTRLAKDYQSEADACAYRIKKQAREFNEKLKSLFMSLPEDKRKVVLNYDGKCGICGKHPCDYHGHYPVPVGEV